MTITTKQKPRRKISPAQSETSRRREVQPDHRVILASRLDMLAGAELQHGHHHAAERLAWRAAELRGAMR